jgi:nicotinamidase-related amidase
MRGSGQKLYSIRVKGHLGATSLAAFPEMVSQHRGADCVLTGLLPDHSALFGILAEIEALGLELVEIRRLVPNPEQAERKRVAHKMASGPVRDQLADHLITPKNAALVLIDYQPSQFATSRSMDRDLLLKNIVSTVKTVTTFNVPIVHSTVNVASGQVGPTVPELAELLENYPPIDRTTVNSWEDVDFVAAVHATGRRKLIFCALWTEVCMAFAALDALREGYEVYPVVDAIAGTSVEAHRAGLERVVQAGGQPISWVSLACELQRDWARAETVPAIVQIVLTDRLLKE